MLGGGGDASVLIPPEHLEARVHALVSRWLPTAARDRSRGGSVSPSANGTTIPAQCDSVTFFRVELSLETHCPRNR